MKRFTLLFIVAMLIITGTAEAGVWGNIKGFFSDQVWAALATGIVFIFATFFGVIFNRSTTTLKETAEFMNVLAAAIEDKKVSREELAAIAKKGKDVVNVWAKTPDKYKVN